MPRLNGLPTFEDLKDLSPSNLVTSVTDTVKPGYIFPLRLQGAIWHQ